jgi:CRP/FNR family transcriptional regulator
MGELSLFSSLPLTDNAQALEATTMCVLQGDLLKGLMAKYPYIAFKVMDELSRRLEKAENLIESISLSSVTKRVAQALLELADGKEGYPPTHDQGDLASQLGMTQETLSRKLAALQDEGLILLKGHRQNHDKREISIGGNQPGAVNAAGNFGGVAYNLPPTSSPSCGDCRCSPSSSSWL